MNVCALITRHVMFATMTLWMGMQWCVFNQLYYLIGSYGCLTSDPGVVVEKSTVWDRLDGLNFITLLKFFHVFTIYYTLINSPICERDLVIGCAFWGISFIHVCFMYRRNQTGILKKQIRGFLWFATITHLKWGILTSTYIAACLEIVTAQCMARTIL